MGEEVNNTFDRRLELVNEAIDKYHTYLVGYVCNLCRNYQTAEDIMQEVWVYVLNHFEESLIGCLPILRRKAWQKYIDFYRAQKRRREVPSDTLPEVSVPHWNDAEPATEAEEKEFRNLFWGNFEGIDLNDQQKEILWLHARYKHSYKEIESMTGIPTSTIGDWIKLARQKVADYLNSQM